ncbi:uncharacterized protein LOC144159032 [Haemaphysalis longicornis]
MASSEKSNRGQETPTGRKRADEPTDKRKPPVRFSGQQDIQLLHEVVSLNPFKDAPPTTVWASISRNLEDVLVISPRRCRERTLLMLDQYIKGDLTSLKRFCTEDEFVIKDELLQQVFEQYMSGPGGYSTRLGFGMVPALNAANAQDEEEVEAEEEKEDGDDAFDLYKGHAVLEDDVTPEQSDSGESSSEAEGNDAEQPDSPKRPRLTRDYIYIEEVKSAVASAADKESAPSASPDADCVARGRHASKPTVGASEFPLQVVTYLLSLEAKEAEAREHDVTIRREELQLEKARLRLGEEKLALEKARFDMERQEREVRLHAAMQERTVFMEVLMNVFSNGHVF